MFVPLKRSHSRNGFPIWFSNELKNLIFQKKIAHKRYKQSNREDHYQIFCQLRRHCGTLSHACYQQYIERSENVINENANSFWSFIRSKADQGAIPKEMHLDANWASDGTGIANIFAKYFSSVFNPATLSPHHQFTFDKSVNLSGIHISPSEIQTALLELNINKGAGPDGIPNRILKLCSYSLYLPLNLIFSQSLNSGIFPKLWKVLHVCPIHKSGSKNDIKNYRPISILSAIPKLFEHCIESALSGAFQHIIDSKQHGFISGRSVDTNLYVYLNFIYKSFEEGADTHAIYTDFRKAFDKVNHNILLSKLFSYGITGMLLAWLKSYLSDREQQVKIESYFSDAFPTTSGVPSGTSFI